MRAPDEDSEPCQPSALYYPSDRLATIVTSDTTITTETSESSLVLDMNFGHNDASELARLSRVAAFHDDASNCIRGFEFHYIDGRSEAFGITYITDTAIRRWTCTKQTVAIDGKGGERIVDVYYVLSGEDSIRLVRGIKVRHSLVCGRGLVIKVCQTKIANSLSKMMTNNSRTLVFAPALNSRELGPWIRAPGSENTEMITGLIAQVQVCCTDTLLCITFLIDLVPYGLYVLSGSSGHS